jgi:cis-3-alkyl-4-acyloxetan-2-one decarboxylase
MRVNGIEVVVEGAGARTVVMVHGWPDTLRLWDGQVAALKDNYRCVRFTLPGFDVSEPGKAYSLDEVVEAITAVVQVAAPGEKVILMLHDWGCFYGYQFASRHPELVERVVGVDIGDAGSRRNLKELGLTGKLAIVAYQYWLALAWRLGASVNGRIGDAMARGMARLLRCPTDPRSIGWQMGYPYAVRWLGAAGGVRGLRTFKPHCPMLFMYGEKKPVMFHSRGWAEELAANPVNQVLPFPTGHWIMVSRRTEFNQAVLAWLYSPA